MKRTEKECCPLLPLVLARTASAHLKYNGLTRELSWNLKTGKSKPVLIVSFPRAKRGAMDDLGYATYAHVNYCPFCGAKVKQ